MGLQRIGIVLLSIFLPFGIAYANADANTFYRTFWSPLHEGQPLDYCAAGGNPCGRKVAKHFCQLMGYQDVDRHVKALNVGLTHRLGAPEECKGWQCNGFMLIRCKAKIVYNSPPSYTYRTQRFVYPRYDNYRVAWCYSKEKQCGHRPAFSFCRRMGYAREQKFEREKAVPATRALGSHELCFGGACDAFKSITCER